MKIFGILLFATLFILAACTPPPPADLRNDPVDDAIDGPNPMVHQQGMQIVDADGNPIKLRGVLLEGWLQWNGPLWGTGLTTETEISDRLVQLASEEAFETFRKGIYDNFITERDIEMIADLGFNVVRVPINHIVLENESGVVDEAALGWAYLDRLLDWCGQHEVYVVLDLHAAPGGQAPWFVADPEPVKLWESEENQTRTIAIWQAIAVRYKDREIIAGYDLLNEPDFPHTTVLLDLYIRLIEAVREVDPYHMIILEGNKFAGDFSFFSQPISSNQVYSFHSYNFFTGEVGEEAIQQLAYLAETQNVPLWNGEFGAHNAEWVTEIMAQYEAPDNQVSGWLFWPWKVVTENNPRYRYLMAILTTDAWDAVRTAVVWPIDPENKMASETAVTGMTEFLESISAENLIIDQEMADILTNFEK